MGEQRVLEVPGGRVWSEVHGDGGGTPLLLLHGGPGVPSDYLASLARLADERPVVFYDQLGCGRSERPPASAGHYVEERFVEEVAAVRAALGLDEVHLLGQSWGGYLAMLYAGERPAGLRSVIYASPLVDVPSYEADAERLKAGLPAEVAATMRDHEARGFTSCPEYAAANLEWWRRHVCRTVPFPEPVERALAGFGEECYSTMWGPSEFTCTGNLKGNSATAALSRISCPQLFTCGRFDETTPESTTAFAEGVGAEVVVFEQSAHLAHLEEEDAYLACVRRFLAGVESSQDEDPAKA